MPLVVNDVKLSEQADSLKVNGINVKKVIVNDADTIWERKYTPTKPQNFIASDTLYNEVVCTWDSASDVDWYQLMEDGVAVTPEEQGISSPYHHITIGTYAYKIRAWNEYGYTDSDADSGTAYELGVGSVVIDYDSVGGLNPETVTGSSGSFVFTPPDGVVEVSLCMCAGGGAGGSSDYQNANLSSGGTAGEIHSSSQAIELSSEILVTIGAGGNAVTGDSTGGTGGSTVFGDITITGGGGGTPNNDRTTPYAGDNAPRSTCGGTFNDGDMGNISAMGGQAGAFGDGGAGSASNTVYGGTGGVGGGGGAVCVSTSAYSGAGGNGRVQISWGG